MQSLIKMATFAAEMQRNEDNGASTKPRNFAVGLQARLWTKAQRTGAMTLKNSTA